MPRAARSPWIMAAPLMLVVALALLWSGYWSMALTSAKAGFTRFERELAARGGALTCSEKTWGGFPFRVSLACERLAIRLSPRGATLETGRVEALAQAYALGHVIAIANGPSRLSLENVSAWSVEHAPMTASFRLTGGGEAMADLIVNDTTLKSGSTVVVQGKHLQLHARNRGAQAVEFAIIGESAKAMLLPGPPLDIARLDLRGMIDNLPPGFAAFSSVLLTAAAAAGARVELRSLDAVLDGSTVTGSGLITLGVDGFPEGRIALRFGDLDRLLASLQTKGLIDGDAAAAGSLLLGLLLGNKRQASLELTFRAGRVLLGPFLLIEHGPIR